MRKAQRGACWRCDPFEMKIYTERDVKVAKYLRTKMQDFMKFQFFSNLLKAYYRFQLSGFSRNVLQIFLSI